MVCLAVHRFKQDPMSYIQDVIPPERGLGRMPLTPPALRELLLESGLLDVDEVDRFLRELDGMTWQTDGSQRIKVEMYTGSKDIMVLGGNDKRALKAGSHQPPGLARGSAASASPRSTSGILNPLP